jgi:hypothetical protein
VGAGTSGIVAVGISTGLGTAALGGGPAAWHVLPLACGLVLLPLALGRRRKALLLVALLAVMVGAATSCATAGMSSGGGSGGSNGAGATPAGTYTIPITVTSSGVSHAATVTLTVD